MGRFPSYPNTILEEIIGPPGTVFEDAAELRYAMLQTAAHVGEVGLKHLEPGFIGYEVVTGQVLEAVDRGVFEDSKWVATILPQFARQAFDPLRPHIEGRRHLVAENWQEPYYGWFAKYLTGGPAMMNFWSGHIPDLAKTQIITGTTDEDRGDYFRIDGVLLDAAPQVAAALSVNVTPAVQLGIDIVMRSMVNMRADQWPRFIELRDEGWTAETAEHADLPGVVRYRPLRAALMIGGEAVMRTVGAASGLVADGRAA